MRYPALVFAAIVLHAQPSKPIFATYLGGGGNEVAGSVTTDSEGNVYVAGRTDSPDFPIKNAVQTVSKSFSQIFVAKFSPTGELLFSTYFGGSANDLASGIATDPAGNVYVTGALQSRDFPVENAFQSQSGGGVDAFVLKLDSSGKVIYATYVGGQFNDLGMSIAADAAGNAYITGRTESPDFPISSGAYQGKPLGYVSGYRFVHAFVTKLDPAGALVYSTFLGGRDGDTGWSVAVDSSGQAHVAGETSSLDFPTTTGALQPKPGRQVMLGAITTDGFLAKLTADGTGLVYSTYIGGPMTDDARSVAVDANGNAYITGQTTDARLPIVNGGQSYLGGDVYLVSSNGGKTFQPQRSGLAAAQVTAILFDPFVSSLVYAGTLQGVFRSVDGGSTWAASGLDGYRIEQIVADPTRPGTLFAGTNFGGGIFRSTDGGDSWTSLDGPFNTKFSIFRAMAVDPAGTGALYTVPSSGGFGVGSDQPLLRISEDGADWSLIGHGLPTFPLSLAVGTDSMLFAGTMSNSSSSRFLGVVSHIPGTVYRHTTDNWLSGGLDDDIGALTFQGNTLYAAGRNFYQSTDGGQTWTTTSFPEGTGNPTKIEVDPRSPSTIYVLRGDLLRSTDGGQSFEVVSQRSFTTMAINPFDSSLHVGTTASADAYVAEFDPAGTLIYSTFIGNASAERAEAIALDTAGKAYIAGFRSPGTLSIGYNGSTFVSSADAPGDSVELAVGNAYTLLGMSSRGIAVAPDGSIVAVMVATQGGLPVQNEMQGNLNGGSDIYLVKWKP